MIACYSTQHHDQGVPGPCAAGLRFKQSPSEPRSPGLICSNADFDEFSIIEEIPLYHDV
ncbi:hypothetical protein M405DRAFT_808020 [Rhizopogon salebrosus TDB-379]|nr:hypothetical protein M405DRAFT_808020 [Rhizopogon salebrosus TDB-379]